MSLDDLFINVSNLPQDFYGFIQLLFLFIVYGYILMNASNLISDGSEFLLLVPKYAGIVGSIVLPILGAVPDGMLILFSGIGSDAQNQLAVYLYFIIFNIIFFFSSSYKINYSFIIIRLVLVHLLVVL